MEPARSGGTDFLSEVPLGAREIVLHTCCAPCSGAIIEKLVAEGVRPVVFYSNSNIFPAEEYLKRKSECTRYARSFGLEVVDDDYDHPEWQCIAAGLENEPERGGRCLQCFRFRLERAARYTHARGIRVLTTTLASSRWKSLSQVDAAGRYACSLYPDVVWWGRNWRKGGLQERRGQIIREQGFYNQSYCGCEWSLSPGREPREAEKQIPEIL